MRRHQIEAGFIAFVAACGATLLAGRSVPRHYENGTTARLTLAERSAFALVATLGLASLLPALYVGFLSDDFVLRSWAHGYVLMPEGNLFARPVALGVWGLVLNNGGTEITLHALTLVLHAFNGWMVWMLVRLCRLSARAAAIAALVFLVWPTQVEPVYWAAGLFDVLMTSAVLPCMWFGLRYSSDGGCGWRCLVASAACAGLALFTKETAICIPALWLCIAAAGGAGLPIRQRRFWVVLAVLTACAASYLVVRVALNLPVSTGTPFTRYVVKEQLSRTLATLALPFSAATLLSHPWLPIALATLLVVLATVVATARDAGRATVAAVSGALWSLLAAAPATGYLFIGPDLEGSRYLYLPAAGWGLFLGAAIELTERSRMRIAARVLGIGGLMAILWGQYATTVQWREAAAERDALLDQGVSIVEEQPCTLVGAERLPGRHKGAQLFTNGYVEALKERSPLARSGAPCRLVWDGTRVKRES